MATRRAIVFLRAAAVTGSALLSGCGGGVTAAPGVWGWTTESPTRLCIDRAQNRAPDSQCETARTDGLHHWYYLKRGGFVPAVGRYVTGGALEPVLPPGAYRTTEASMREARAVQQDRFGDLGGGSHTSADLIGGLLRALHLRG